MAEPFWHYTDIYFIVVSHIPLVAFDMLLFVLYKPLIGLIKVWVGELWEHCYTV